MSSMLGVAARLPASSESMPRRTLEAECERPPGNGEAVDLSREIPAMLHTAARLAHTTECRLEYAVRPGLLAQADSVVFREAMAGLVGQAIARAPGGQVLVTARSQDGWIQLGICDDGPGAAGAEHEAGLREPKHLLERYAGSVQVAPHPGQGTVVTLRLRQAASAFAPRGNIGAVLADS